MMNKINKYIFFQIIRSCLLIFFIFVSIAWLLQLTRLFTVTYLIQIDIFSIIYLSIFLIPNLLSIIIPFILIFGILLSFIKMNKDKEIIAMYSMGMKLDPIRYSLILFTTLITIIYILLNFYFSPKIYEIYKNKEFELRNTLNFNKIISSNFLKINENTTVDFVKNDNKFEDIFINYNEEKNNIIYSKRGIIKNIDNTFIFQLTNGFKLSINQHNEIEKLEFKNYIFTIDNIKTVSNNIDRNTLTIFDDINNKDFLNISFKLFDILLAIIIILIFYKNNIVNINFSLKNNLLFIIISIFLIIVNQFFKASNTNMLFYSSILTILIILSLISIYLKSKYE